MAFEKGMAKVPGSGRKTNEALRTAQELARPYTAEAIERLASIMRGDDGPSASRAAIALIDRAWGRPDQTVTATVTTLVQAANLETLEQRLAESLASRSKEQPAGRSVQ